MNSKALLLLAMLVASTLLISTEAARKDLDNKNDKFETNGIDESKYGDGPWHGGGGYHCYHGCCDYGYHGGCRRCCYYPGEHLDIGMDAEPHN
ncbi:hypothetical protein QL285_001262 [Trifolium repens]|nr:hypothetical protein QL285_001262 [Trifolium repens]